MEETQRPRGRRGLAIAVTAVPILLIGGWLFAKQTAPAKVVAAGTPLLYDDFAFTATRAETVPTIGSSAAQAGNEYLILDVQVQNRAAKVEFVFDPSVVTAVLDDGRHLEADPSAQTVIDTLVTALGAKIKRNLATSESETYRLVFLAPSGTKSVNVSFRFGGGIGTFLDNALYGKAVVKVPVAPSPQG